MRVIRIFTGLRGVLLLGLMMCAVAVGQDKSGASAKQENGSIVTATGCLTGSNGRYTLGTMSDKLYILQGDDALFKKFNGKRVHATGRVSEPQPHTSDRDVLSQQPPTLTVTKLEKASDTCD